jgi:ankyrin repeat protein
MDEQAEALKAIRRYVWSGLYDPEEVVIIVGESLGEPGEFDEDWLRAEVGKELARKRAEEATWPATSDCDRLDQVFKTLEAQGIIVEQDAGLTKSDGLEDVTEEYEASGGEKSGIVGYCFYHGQDLDHVMESGELYLAFGDFLEDKDRRGEIGRRIKSALEDAGFTVEWSGSVRERLLVRGIRWQRRAAGAEVIRPPSTPEGVQGRETKKQRRPAQGSTVSKSKPKPVSKPKKVPDRDTKAKRKPAQGSTVSKSKPKPVSKPTKASDRDAKAERQPAKGSDERKSHPEAVKDALIAGGLKAIEQYVTRDNINLVDKYGYTLLSLAAVAGDLNLKMVQLLVKHGADVNVRIAEGWTLLHSACHLLRKDLARVLLRAGSDPNAVAAAGHTPLTKVLMAFNPKKDLIETLLEHGSDPEAKHAGESAVDIATRTGQIDLFSGREKIRRVKKSAKPGPAKASKVSKPHPQAVIEAVDDGDLKTIEQYVTRDNIDWVDKDGHTLLSRAATGGEVKMKIVRHLVRNGADVNVRLREGWTLLHSAADCLHKDLAFVLLNAGCDPNAVDDVEHTPLVKVLWAQNPKKDIIEALLEHGADPDARHGGKSDLEIARQTGQINLFPAR